MSQNTLDNQYLHLISVPKAKSIEVMKSTENMKRVSLENYMYLPVGSNLSNISSDFSYLRRQC